jgi:hypothetical protein
MPLLFLLLLALAAALAAGAWYGRLQERARWTRRLFERGLHPDTLMPRRPSPPLEPLTPDTDAMRDAMEVMQREVERLAEGQRFLTEVLTERRHGPPPPVDRPLGPGDERPSPADRRP